MKSKRQFLNEYAVAAAVDDEIGRKAKACIRRNVERWTTAGRITESQKRAIFAGFDKIDARA